MTSTRYPNRVATLVTLDGPDFPAMVDPTNRWNGWLSPCFDLTTVRKLAKFLDQQAEEFGRDCVDTVHIVEGGTNPDGTPRAIVTKVSWQYLPDSGPEECTDIIEPDEDGLYGIGGWEWCWYAASWWCVDCDDGTDWHETHCSGCGQLREDCEMPADEKAEQYAANQAAEQQAAARAAKPEPAGDIDTRVCIDTDVISAPARVTPPATRNSYVSPRFTLDAARQLAADTARLNEQYGAGTFDTVHVIDGGLGGDALAVVMLVGWQHYDERDPERTVEIIARDADGLYAIGGGSGWTWCIETWSCDCGAFPEAHEAQCPKCGAEQHPEPVERCKNGHAYDEANTYRHKSRRTCRTCRRERDRARRAERRTSAAA
ncbi:hypothetical protein [Streptomyces sp. NRRL S-350]|uniref:hypothetical protein n=1 Tax=Streptomyces sp. NRRL S-350 TaxID=1463902 RepID=UPI0004C26BE1|nr:hypothetical protein [Streptomyces sp. NRRL S-350]